MSHVTVIEIEVRDLQALRAACEELGLELVEGQTRFKWYGHYVGDYPLPAGFTGEDMGKCDHVIKVKGNKDAYEIGVVARRDGKPGYHLMWDFWSGGFGLEAAVGAKCHKLCEKYAEHVVLKQVKPLQAKGWNKQTFKNSQGETVIRLVRG